MTKKKVWIDKMLPVKRTIKRRYSCSMLSKLSLARQDRIGVVMVSVLASSAVDRGF